MDMRRLMDLVKEWEDLQESLEEIHKEMSEIEKEYPNLLNSWENIEDETLKAICQKEYDIEQCLTMMGLKTVMRDCKAMDCHVCPYYGKICGIDDYVVATPDKWEVDDE